MSVDFRIPRQVGADEIGIPERIPEDLKNAINSVNNQMKNLRDSRDDVVNKFQALQESMNAVTVASLSCQAAQLEKKQEIRTLEEEISNIRSENQTSQTQYDETFTNLNNQILSLQRSAQESQEQYEIRTSELESRIAVLTSDNEESKEQMDELMNAIRVLSENIVNVISGDQITDPSQVKYTTDQREKLEQMIQTLGDSQEETELKDKIRVTLQDDS